jgi:hypothetical protein
VSDVVDPNGEPPLLLFSDEFDTVAVVGFNDLGGGLFGCDEGGNVRTMGVGAVTLTNDAFTVTGFGAKGGGFPLIVQC